MLLLKDKHSNGISIPLSSFPGQAENEEVFFYHFLKEKKKSLVGDAC